MSIESAQARYDAMLPDDEPDEDEDLEQDDDQDFDSDDYPDEQAAFERAP